MGSALVAIHASSSTVVQANERLAVRIYATVLCEEAVNDGNQNERISQIEFASQNVRL